MPAHRFSTGSLRWETPVGSGERQAGPTMLDRERLTVIPDANPQP